MARQKQKPEAIAGKQKIRGIQPATPESQKISPIPGDTKSDARKIDRLSAKTTSARSRPKAAKGQQQINTEADKRHEAKIEKSATKKKPAAPKNSNQVKKVSSEETSTAQKMAGKKLPSAQKKGVPKQVPATQKKRDQPSAAISKTPVRRPTRSAVKKLPKTQTRAGTSDSQSLDETVLSRLSATIRKAAITTEEEIPQRPARPELASGASSEKVKKSKRKAKTAESLNVKPVAQTPADAQSLDRIQKKVRSARAVSARSAPLGRQQVAESRFSSHLVEKTDQSQPSTAVLSQSPPTESQLVLLPRDPDWLYAFWEFSPTDRQFHQLDALHGAPLVFMRLVACNPEGMPVSSGSFDLMLLADAGNWLIQIPRIDRDWQATLGYIGRTGDFVPIVSSNRVGSLHTGLVPALITGAREVFPEAEIAFADPDLLPLAPPWPILAAEHEFFLKGPRPSLATLTHAQLKPGGASEWSMPMLEIERPLEEKIIGSVGSGGFQPVPVSSQPEIPTASQPFGFESPVRTSDFWLWVRTELIVYGATSSDAHVTIKGLPINVRSDGTFSVRFALPDGEQEYPVQAVNAASDRTIEITPVVRQRTKK